MTLPIPVEWAKAELEAEVEFERALTTAAMTGRDADIAAAAEALAKVIDARALIDVSRSMGWYA